MNCIPLTSSMSKSSAGIPRCSAGAWKRGLNWSLRPTRYRELRSLYGTPRSVIYGLTWLKVSSVKSVKQELLFSLFPGEELRLRGLNWLSQGHANVIPAMNLASMADRRPLSSIPQLWCSMSEPHATNGFCTFKNISILLNSRRFVIWIITSSFFITSFFSPLWSQPDGRGGGVN